MMGEAVSEHRTEVDSIDGLEVGVSVFIAEGWWHPNVKDGRVHEHLERPGGGWSAAAHRTCEQVYTQREVG